MTTATVTAIADREIDRIDAEIAALIQARSAAVQSAAVVAAASGQARSAQRHEMASMRRFEAELGKDGVALAMTLMKIARSGAVAVSRESAA